MPETPLSVMRGSTTKNFVSSTIRPAAVLAIFAVTSTFVKSGDRRTAVTWPMFTSLYLTTVLPASRPSATLKTMVMVRPSLRMRWMAIPTATTAARIGMIQTTEIRVRLRRPTVACGRRGKSVSSAIVSPHFSAGIPDEARIEGFGRNHREHDHRREKQHPRSGRHRHQRVQLHEGDGEGVDEHVEHRPASDELDQTIETSALPITRDRAALYRDQEIGQRDQLAEGDHNAGHQHNERKRPGAGGVEEHHPAHDGVGIDGPEGGGGEHGQDVGRDVANGGGDDERPRVLNGVVPARCELRAAARTVRRLGQGGRLRQQAARLAGDQSRLRGSEGSFDHCSSAHAIRFQASRGSTVIEIAVSSTISAPTAYMPIPASTVASSAILISATRMPRIITSIMDQGRAAFPQRSSSPTHAGAGGRLTARRTVSMSRM